MKKNSHYKVLFFCLLASIVLTNLVYYLLSEDKVNYFNGDEKPGIFMIILVTFVLEMIYKVDILKKN